VYEIECDDVDEIRVDRRLCTVEKIVTFVWLADLIVVYSHCVTSSDSGSA